MKNSKEKKMTKEQIINMIITTCHTSKCEDIFDGLNYGCCDCPLSDFQDKIENMEDKND